MYWPNPYSPGWPVCRRHRSPPSRWPAHLPPPCPPDPPCPVCPTACPTGPNCSVRGPDTKSGHENHCLKSGRTPYTSNDPFARHKAHITAPAAESPALFFAMNGGSGPGRSKSVLAVMAPGASLTISGTELTASSLSSSIVRRRRLCPGATAPRATRQKDPAIEAATTGCPFCAPSPGSSTGSVLATS